MIKNYFLVLALATGACSYAQTTVFEENFEDPAKRQLWTIGDRDGDSDTWEYLDAQVNEVDSFTGFFAVSFSWYFQAFTPDNTLTSPVISLPDNANLSLNFKVAAGDDGLFEEHYAVYVIPANSTFTGTETPVFEETLDGGYLLAAKNVNVDISAYKGRNVQIVFRHYNCSDIFYIGLDDVKILDNSLSVSDIKKSEISIYPNPSSEVINIKNAEKIDTVRIIDMSGKVLITTSSTQIDIKNLAKGTYMINIYSGKGVISKKFIKN